jgi:DNA-binding NarL/FixJ family response regulator
MDQFDRIHVVGEGGNGQEAVQLAKNLTPDVVLMDVNMPTMDGVEATRQITAGDPRVVVIGISVQNSPQVAEAMKQAGAAAYLTKDAAPEQLYQAICDALEGRDRRATPKPP